jgi:acetyl esterase/lipase
MKQLLFAAYILILISSCQKEVPPLPDPYDASRDTVIVNEAYGADAFQKMDVYLPKGRGKATKVVCLLHGGAWTVGDKSDLTAFMIELNKQFPEVALINANYRLASAGANQHPAQMEDIKKMLDYISTQANTWHIGTTFALGGASAGGHLSMLYAYGNDAAKRIKTVISIVGPANFLDPYYLTNPLFAAYANVYLGKTIAQDPALYKEASPAQIVKAGAPPTFMAYAGLDLLVPESNAIFLRSQLDTLKVVNSYNFYPMEQHDMSPAAIADFMPKMVTFLKANLK